MQNFVKVVSPGTWAMWQGAHVSVANQAAGGAWRVVLVNPFGSVTVVAVAPNAAAANAVAQNWR